MKTKQLKKFLNNLDAILVSSWSNILYLTSYPGFSREERECFLLITKKGQYLITDRRYSGAIKKLVPSFKLIDTGATSILVDNDSNIFKKLGIKKIGVEENDLTLFEYKNLSKIVKKIEGIDLAKLRASKEPIEAKNIKLACRIGDLAFDFILSKLRVGITEKEIAELLISFFKTKNADFSFFPIVAFGKNSAVPHHLSGKTKLTKNQIVLLDFGVKINNYCSDMSRTVFFGSASAEFKKMHQAVLEAQIKAIKSIRVGMKASEIDKVARDYIISNNFPNIIHSVGHGIGVDVHEFPHLSPNSNDILTQGMVFSVEPGIYLPDFGGVRIEDLILITKDGPELISHANRNIIEV